MGHSPLARDRGRTATVAAMAVVFLVVSTGCIAVGLARRALRTPGSTMIALPDEVAARYACESRRLPYFVFEKQEVNPDRVHPGDEFNHRFVYALCPREATVTTRGVLRTRIRYKGRVLLQDKDDAFELQPGRWAVDSFIRLPDDARPGVYALELEFTSRRIRFEHSATFGVDAR